MSYHDGCQHERLFAGALHQASFSRKVCVDHEYLTPIDLCRAERKNVALTAARASASNQGGGAERTAECQTGRRPGNDAKSGDEGFADRGAPLRIVCLGGGQLVFLSFDAGTLLWRDVKVVQALVKIALKNNRQQQAENRNGKQACNA